ncbi:MAG: DUF2917 domain-containing protein [Anaerolineaceae bacterium]|nr:DUF2917 domain-containing protein [Anaerolineaceae bacterium]
MTTYTQLLGRHANGQAQLDAPCSETMDPGTETLFPLRGKERSVVLKKCLAKKSLLKLVGDPIGEKISCLKGVIWITQSGNPEDILVCAGESFTITQKGILLIQGLEETNLRITGLSTVKSGLNFPAKLL